MTFCRSLSLALLLACLWPGASTQAQVMIEDRAAPQTDSPFLMRTGVHAKRVCEEEKDRGFTLACLMWINGASQGQGWTRSLSPKLFPDYCPPTLDFNLSTSRAIFLKYLNTRPSGKLGEPAILLFREAMAAEYPCPKPGNK